MTTYNIYLGTSVTGNVTTPDNALGSPDGTYTTDTSKRSWTHTWSFDVSSIPTSASISGTQTFTLYVRKSATGGSNVTIDSITLSGDATHTNSTGWTITDATTTVIINVPDTDFTGINVDIQITGTGGGGGPNERGVELDAVLWEANVIGGFSPFNLFFGAMQ
jgi:hypothetical protein